jgi:hypothetical protein
MEPADLADLHDLVISAEIGVELEPQANTLYRMVGIGPNSLLVRGPALDLHNALSLRLAQSALGASGHVPQSVANLLDEFIRRANATGEVKAIAWLEAELITPPQNWTFVQGLKFHTPLDCLTVGKCSIVRKLDDIAPGLPGAFPMISELGNPLILTTVRARDHFSARLLARETFAETEALLTLMAGWNNLPDNPHLEFHGTSQRYSTGASARALIQAVDSIGQLWPGYLEASDALARFPTLRTDWEKRTLAASRWFRVAIGTSWPSQSIAASMSALECLLVKPTERNKKRDPIAKRATDVGRLRGKTQAEQVAWLNTMYGYRNDAVHAGEFHQDEIDAQALMALTRSVMHWAIHHLDPLHGKQGGGQCLSLTDVLAAH